VLLAIGARFDDRVIGDPANIAQNPRKIIHIDIDPSSISKRVKVDVPIVGNIPDVLEDLLKLLKGAATPAIDAWWKQIGDWRARNCLKYDRSSKIIKPQFVLEKLYEITGGEAFVTSDVGQHQMWAAQFYKFDKPRRWINSGGLGTMGFGLPAAMGAAVGVPDIPTCLITGDASIQMNSQELATCSENGIPVKVFIMNNGYLGMVRQWQELFWDRRYSHVDMGSWPDFVKLAEAYGATGMRLTEKKTLVEDMRKAIETPGPVVVDVRVTREENTYPMIAPGAAARDMVG